MLLFIRQLLTYANEDGFWRGAQRADVKLTHVSEVKETSKMVLILMHFNKTL